MTPADGEIFACDGRVDEEKLTELLKVQAELSNLDYKERYDFTRGTKSRSDFVKDSAAMMTMPNGGYLIVGVDGHGIPQPNNGVTQQAFDETRLRDVLRDFLGADIVLHTAVHTVDGTAVAVIYLGPKPGGLFPIMDKDGTYNDANGLTAVNFREGEVFTRDGTSTRRWHNSDLPRILTNHDNRIRASEQERLAPVIAQIQRAQAGSALAAGAAGSVTWHLPADEFDAAVLELIRSGDQVGFKKATRDLATASERILAGVESGDIEQLLDRAASLLGSAISYGTQDLLRLSIGALHRTYLAAGRLSNDQNRAIVWRDIAARILAATALAVREKNWEAIDDLVRQPADRKQSWIRDALGKASLAGVLVNDDGKEFGGGLLSFARFQAARLPALRPDVGVADELRPGVEAPGVDRLLDSICQADLLACIDLVLHGSRDWYPSFGDLYARRSQPIAEVLATDPALRAALTPDHQDSREDVAIAITFVVNTIDGATHFRNDHESWEPLLRKLDLWQTSA